MLSFLGDIGSRMDGVESSIDKFLYIKHDLYQYPEWNPALNTIRSFHRSFTYLVLESQRFSKHLVSAIERRVSAPKKTGIKSVVMDYCNLSDRGLGLRIGHYCGHIQCLAEQERELSNWLSSVEDPDKLKVASIAEDARTELMLAAGSIARLSGLLVINRRDGLAAPLRQVALLVEDLQFDAVYKDIATLLSECRKCPWSNLQDERLPPLLGDMERRITRLDWREDALLRSYQDRDRNTGIDDEIGELREFYYMTSILACKTSSALQDLITIIRADDLAATNRAIYEVLSEYKCYSPDMYRAEEIFVHEKLPEFRYEDSMDLASTARKVRDAITMVGECIEDVYDTAYHSVGNMALPSGNGVAHDDGFSRTTMDSQDITVQPGEEPAYYHGIPDPTASRIDIVGDFANGLGREDKRRLPSYDELQYWVDPQDVDGQFQSAGLLTPESATGPFSGLRSTSPLPTPRAANSIDFTQAPGCLGDYDGHYAYEEDEPEGQVTASKDGGLDVETDQGDPSTRSPTSPPPSMSEMDETWSLFEDEAVVRDRHFCSMAPEYVNNGALNAYIPPEYNDRSFGLWVVSTEYNDGPVHSRSWTEYNHGPFHPRVEEVFSDDESDLISLD